MIGRQKAPPLPVPKPHPAADVRPAKHPGISPSKWPVRPAVSVVVVITLFIVAQVLAGVVISGLLWATRGVAGKDITSVLDSSVLLQFTYILLAESLTLGALYRIMRYKQVSFGSLGWCRARWRDLAYAVLAFIAYFGAYVLLLAVVTPLVPGLDVNQKQDIGFNGAAGLSLVPVAVALIVLAPVTEEILMRGFLFTSLRSRSGFVMSAIVTSVVFASAHLLGGQAGAGPLWIAGIDTFVLSLVLCFLRERTGRLWAGIGLHALKNSIAFIALFLIHTN